MNSKEAKAVLKRHTGIVPEGPDLASSVQQLAQAVNQYTTQMVAIYNSERAEREAAKMAKPIVQPKRWWRQRRYKKSSYER